MEGGLCATLEVCLRREEQLGERLPAVGQGAGAEEGWEVEVSLDSRELCRASEAMGYAVWGVSVKEQRSRRNGKLGREGSVVWVDEGLRATLSVLLRRGAMGRARSGGGRAGERLGVLGRERQVEVSLDSIDCTRASLEVGGEIHAIAKLSQRSRRGGSYGFAGSKLYVDDGLRASFRVWYREGGAGIAAHDISEPLAAAHDISEALGGALNHRGDQLNALASRTDQLAQSSQAFYNAARKLNSGR